MAISVWEWEAQSDSKLVSAVTFRGQCSLLGLCVCVVQYALYFSSSIHTYIHTCLWSKSHPGFPMKDPVGNFM